MIHPTAVIHPGAELASTVEVGAHAVIDSGVTIDADCHIGPFVYLTGQTRIGKANQFHAGCVIGGEPQDLKYGHEPTELVIGDHNIFREQVTVHRSNTLAEPTRIGSHNLFMVNSHVGHNCQLANYIVLVNGALLGGHVRMDDRALVSGHCMLHQFVRVGTLALMQGGSGISKDLPPFTIATGNNHICGLNIIGLRRAGIPAEDRLKLKRLYHLLFRSGLKRRIALERAQQEFAEGPARALVEFVAASTRGTCSDLRARAEDDLEV